MHGVEAEVRQGWDGTVDGGWCMVHGSSGSRCLGSLGDGHCRVGWATCPWYQRVPNEVEGVRVEGWKGVKVYMVLRESACGVYPGVSVCRCIGISVSVSIVAIVVYKVLMLPKASKVPKLYKLSKVSRSSRSLACRCGCRVVE